MALNSYPVPYTAVAVYGWDERITPARPGPRTGGFSPALVGSLERSPETSLEGEVLRGVVLGDEGGAGVDERLGRLAVHRVHGGREPERGHLPGELRDGGLHVTGLDRLR